MKTGTAVVCSTCGVQGLPKKRVRGSFWIELILWICFLIPGLIYTIWRLTTKALVCKSCGSSALVPITSPVGQQMRMKWPGEAAAQSVDPLDQLERLEALRDRGSLSQEEFDREKRRLLAS